MKAVVMERTRTLMLEELDKPEAGPGEVLVRSDYCGTCEFCRSGHYNLPLHRFNDAFTALRHPDRTIKVQLQCSSGE